MDKTIFKPNTLDLILLHNIIQYLEPDSNTLLTDFQKNLTYSFQYLYSILKPFAILSVINESRIEN